MDGWMGWWVYVCMYGWASGWVGRWVMDAFVFACVCRLRDGSGGKLTIGQSHLQKIDMRVFILGPLYIWCVCDVVVLMI